MSADCMYSVERDDALDYDLATCRHHFHDHHCKYDMISINPGTSERSASRALANKELDTASLKF